jgi:Fic family protein
LLLRVDTIRTGPFFFNASYSKEKIFPLLAQAKILFATVATIPILPNLSAQLEEELIRKSIFGTAAIEGNPLSEEEVSRILTEADIEKKRERAEVQIRNLKATYETIKKMKSVSSFKLSESLIKSIHELITKESEGPENSPGQYRDCEVKVGDKAHGGIYTPPKILEDIRTLMSIFVDWINSEELLKEDAAIRAALAHYHLGLIHPFGNGNGRTARAIEALVLKNEGIKFIPHMLSNYYYKNIDGYFSAFSLSERNPDNEITPFLEFFLNGVIKTLQDIQVKVFSFIRLSVLKEYYISRRRKKKITQRQYDLLILLIEAPEVFSLKDIFEKDKFMVIYRHVTERTARRDLKKLVEQSLLKTDQVGHFHLNYEVLGS